MSLVGRTPNGQLQLKLPGPLGDWGSSRLLRLWAHVPPHCPHGLKPVPLHTGHTPRWPGSLWGFPERATPAASTAPVWRRWVICLRAGRSASFEGAAAAHFDAGRRTDAGGHTCIGTSASEADQRSQTEVADKPQADASFAEEVQFGDSACFKRIYACCTRAHLLAAARVGAHCGV